MFFATNSIKKPKRTFNLLHLETSEFFLLSLKVSMYLNGKFDEQTNKISKFRIRGKLHLCSRSFIFEPKNTKMPLIKMKFSNNLIMKILKGFDQKTLYQVLSIKWNYQLLQEDIENLDLNQLILYQKKEEQVISSSIKCKKTNQKSGNHNELIEKLLITNKQAKRQTPISTQQQNSFFIKVDKIFVVNRDPISPYLTEKSEDNFIFSISKSNSKQNVIRFLKIYEGIMQTQEESEFIDVIISTTLNEGINEYKQIQQQNGQKIDMIYKARRITPEGQIYGLFTVVNEEWVSFLPLINSPNGEVQEFKMTDIKFFLKYRYMFQHIGLEVWVFNKKRSILFAFEDHNVQEAIYRFLAKKASKAQLTEISCDKASELWQNGQISNFEYLILINTFANRSFNDLSAYPVFPWVINEYHTKAAFFRDLSKPIGALNKHRLRKYKDYFSDQLKEKNRELPPYLYPTHYSSPGQDQVILYFQSTVVYYLIRKIPEFVIKLQNGVFGPTDRIFRGIDSTWYTTLNLHADSKEMIPEFYSSEGDFLVNCDKLELGVTQDGEVIDDSVLPAWAKDANDFMIKMRAALESDYVTANLHKWIDLIFGFKQNGEQALNSDNLFYPLTYAENVKWDKCRTSLERQALEVQVAEFGQVPIRLFASQHFQRKLRVQPNLRGFDDDKRRLEEKVQELMNQNEKLVNDFSKNKGRVSGGSVDQLQLMVTGLQQENDKLKFNLESIKHEMEFNNKEKIETFNSNFDQEEFEQNDFDFLNDESNVKF